MTAETPPNKPQPGRTLLGTLTAVGDMIIISVTLLVLLLGVVTAGPASAAAIEARKQVSMSGPSTPVRTLLSGTRVHFRALWPLGPIVVTLGIVGWISTAFWLVAPAPLGVIMMAAILSPLAAFSILVLAIPVAATPGVSRRETARHAIRLAVSRPLVSVLALAAAVAAVILAFRVPTVGIVAISAVLVEISWRAWGQPRIKNVER